MRDYIREVRADLDAAIESAGQRAMLVSGEDIGVMQRDGLVRMRQHLRRHFDQIRIVGYVRPPAGFITSGFQQRVRGGAMGLDLDRVYRN